MKNLKSGESAIEEKMRTLTEKADMDAVSEKVERESESISVGEGAEQGV